MQDVPEVSPRYEHGCPACLFLGTHDHDDLYVCKPEVGGPSVLARHSDEGHDYSSSLVSIVRRDLATLASEGVSYAEAYKRALTRELV